MTFAKELTERFLRYVAIPSESNGRAGVVPSSEGQRELARLLEAELREMGLEEIELNEHAILTAKLPGNKAGVPAIGWVAHLDTVPVALSPEVHPQLIHYEGGDVCLNPEKDIWLRLAEHPELGEYVGQDIVFTDGTPGYAGFEDIVYCYFTTFFKKRIKELRCGRTEIVRLFCGD